MNFETEEIDNLIANLKTKYANLSIDELEMLILNDLSEIKTEIRGLLQEIKQKD